jgi:GTP cyclohydrolase FolE2
MTATLPDVQARPDLRDLVIDRVGVKGLRYPMLIRGASESIQSTVALIDAYVRLPASAKGTHMSRFIEVLEAYREPLDCASAPALLERMLQRLGAEHGEITLRAPYFISKAAPVSGVQSLLDYEVSIEASDDPVNGQRSLLQVTVPVTSLCPCSKEISEYGAHNQRSLVMIRAQLLSPIPLEQLIRVAEEAASCELFGLLKRADEKYVTERAYDNPKFVEDLVRDVARALSADARIASYAVSAENFESIHNHSAYAEIRCERAGA